MHFKERFSEVVHDLQKKKVFQKKEEKKEDFFGK